MKTQILQQSAPRFGLAKLYGTWSGVIRPPKTWSGAKLAEEFTERTAGIWVPFIFYALGGVYMLTFWGILDRAAYHLLALGAISIIIAVALYSLSRWAYWLGLFMFPLLLAEFVYALTFSVNIVGWNPDLPNALFQASTIIYIIFLVLSLVLLIDKRNVLKNDRILDMLGRPLSATAEPKETKKDSTAT